MALISVKEAADELNFTPHYIRKLLREGKISGGRIEGKQQIQVDSSSLEKYKKTDGFQDDLQELKKPMRITIKDAVIDVEDHFETDIISYIASPNHKHANILPDDCVVVDDLLNTLSPIYPGTGGKKFESITLFLHSAGGILETAIKIVDIIEQYANHFNVVVPFMAKSAASLICLSAEKIYLTTLAELGPIDPIIQSPTNPNLMVPARSIDDFMKYYADEKNKSKTENSKIEEIILRKLEEAIDPYLLGCQKSALAFSQREVEKRLRQKINDKDDLEHAIEEFTTENASHAYPLTFKKLKDLKIKGVEIISESNKTNAVKTLLAIYQDFMTRNCIIKVIGNREINRNTINASFIQKQVPTKTQP